MFVPGGHCAKPGAIEHLGDWRRWDEESPDTEMPNQTQTIQMISLDCQDDGDMLSQGKIMSCDPPLSDKGGQEGTDN